MGWSEAQEVADSIAAQIGHDALKRMPQTAIALHVRHDMPGESHTVQSNVTQALIQLRDDL
jgi:hypothetical protein